MADPILPDVLRAQVIFHGGSGLPKDRFVNTFAFQAPQAFGTDLSAERAEVLRLLTNFYTGLNGGTSTIVSSLTGYSKVELRTYNLNQPLPREPHIVDPWPDFPTGGSGPLPYEVALCASFETTRRGPRGRGRVFLGPLRTSVLSGGGTQAEPRPATTFQDAARLAMAQMAGDNVLMQWGLVSQTEGAFYAATGGWVDNAFDTQRSRGTAPTSRLAWGTAA